MNETLSASNTPLRGGIMSSKNKTTINISEVENGFLITKTSFPQKNFIAKDINEVLRNIHNLLSLDEENDPR